MTTRPVTSITDDLLAELEALADAAVANPGGYEDSEEEFEFMSQIRPLSIASIITRLRAAERDAARYRWLVEDCTTKHHGEQRPVLVCAYENPVIGWREEIARRIDAAMGRDQ